VSSYRLLNDIKTGILSGLSCAAIRGSAVEILSKFLANYRLMVKYIKGGTL